MEEIKDMIRQRLVHLEERKALHGLVGKSSLSLYARGFSSGLLHRLIAEHYFLKLLLEEVEET